MHHLGDAGSATTQPQQLAPLSAILLRIESESSSQIEDITAGAKALALAIMSERVGPKAAKVAAHVEAMLAAGRMAADLTPESVLETHAALMHDQPYAGPGRWGQTAVRIGGHAPPPSSRPSTPSPTAADAPAASWSTRCSDEREPPRG